MTLNPLMCALMDRIPLVPINGFPKIVSSGHRRSILIKTNTHKGRCFSLKGVGWVHGPPWAFVSPKDDQLFFGLMDRASADREIKVSEWFEQAEIHSTRVRYYIPLNEYELSLVGLKPDVKFKNGTMVDPVVLVTESLAAFRVNDYAPQSHKEWLEEFKYLNTIKDKRDDTLIFHLNVFAAKLAKSIDTYQFLGAANDTLSADNVTVAGEITDYEWIYVPGIPLPDGSTDIMLKKRQLKEAFYYVDILLSLADGLSINISIREISEIGLKIIAESKTGFADGLRQLVRAS